MRTLLIILALLHTLVTDGQQGFTFTRFDTEDGSGLSSNVVHSLYQDERGYIWVGHANGLQRFDGSKFITFGGSRADQDVLPFDAVTQIIPADSNTLLLNFGSLKQVGIFNRTNFSYRKLSVVTKHPVLPRADFHIWKDSKGEIYLTIHQYGVLRYDRSKAAFVEDRSFPFPPAFVPAIGGYYDDAAKGQVWFAGEKGICVYDRSSRQMWHRGNNPRALPILANQTLQDRPTQIHIDRQRRFWIFTWPRETASGQQKYCLDSSGKHYLQRDTIGLHDRPSGYTEYSRFYESPVSGLWIYGKRVLFNWDARNRRFHFIRSGKSDGVNSMEYDVVNQVIEDRDRNIWIATDQGLFFTSHGSGTYSVINLLFENTKTPRSINDILEMPGGSLWFSSWGEGVFALDSQLKEKAVPFYRSPPPKDWAPPYQGAVRLGWTLFRHPPTGDVWLGCNGGVIVIYNPKKGTTRYLKPLEAALSTIRYIAGDRNDNVWLSTQGGRLIKWDSSGFKVMLDIGTIIYKVLIDKEGLIWLATHEKGLYCFDPQSGKVLRQFTSASSEARLHSNTGYDIEQLNDSTIVYGAGALNFINKRTGRVTLARYQEGLPSNSVHRVRMDAEGYLWIVTANGLSRYNPFTKRFTTYGRKDGITLGTQTLYADYFSSSRYIMFGGRNALMMFKPSLFANTQPPPNVVITDFKLFNQFIPVDSLMQAPQISLQPTQNSFSIYFSALSFQHRDRLTYFFKMDGIDKEWMEAEGVNFQNYSLLPPGEYTFRVYAQNIEGVRSPKTSELKIFIRYPFWQTKWFVSVMIFLVLLVVYFFHSQRVGRLMAVEKIRNRVARDLHDDMGSTLSTINILSAMAKSKMSSDAVKTAGYLSKISDNSQRMMEAMDDIVWSIKPSNDSMQRVIARMREFATSVLEAKDMTFTFDVGEGVTEVKLGMEARRDFFLIFKEAVNNVAKYSRASEAEIKITCDPRFLTLVVRDNGVGFDVQKADSGNGLGNMTKRAQALNGKLQIHSTEGSGTKIKLTLPTRS